MSLGTISLASEGEYSEVSQCIFPVLYLHKKSEEILGTICIFIIQALFHKSKLTAEKIWASQGEDIMIKGTE